MSNVLEISEIESLGKLFKDKEYRELIEERALPEYGYTRMVKECIKYRDFCVAVGYGVFELTIRPGRSEFLIQELRDAIYKDNEDKPSELYPLIERDDENEDLKDCYEKGIKKGIKAFKEGVNNNKIIPKLIGDLIEKGIKKALAGSDALPEGIVSVAKIIDSEERFEMEHFSIVARMFNCRIKILKINQKRELERKIYGRSSAFPMPLTFLIIEGDKGSSELFILYEDKISSSKEFGIDASVVAEVKKMREISDSYKNEIDKFLERQINNFTKAIAENKHDNLMKNFAKDSESLSNKITHAEVCQKEKLLSYIPSTSLKCSNPDCNSSSALLKISCGKCTFCKDCIISVMESLEINEPLSMIACSCYSEGESYKEIPEVDLLEIAPDIYDRLKKARKCHYCDNQGTVYSDEKWLCNTHSKCFNKDCKNTADNYLDYAGLYICKNCYEGRRCSIVGKNGPCKEVGDYLHEKCQKNWLCKYHIIFAMESLLNKNSNDFNRIKCVCGEVLGEKYLEMADPELYKKIKDPSVEEEKKSNGHFSCNKCKNILEKEENKCKCGALYCTDCLSNVLKEAYQNQGMIEDIKCEACNVCIKSEYLKNSSSKYFKRLAKSTGKCLECSKPARTMDCGCAICLDCLKKKKKKDEFECGCQLYIHPLNCNLKESKIEKIFGGCMIKSEDCTNVPKYINRVCGNGCVFCGECILDDIQSIKEADPPDLNGFICLCEKAMDIPMLYMANKKKAEECAPNCDFPDCENKAFTRNYNECQHWYCKICIQEYLDANDSESIPCPIKKCKKKLTPESIRIMGQKYANQVKNESE